MADVGLSFAALDPNLGDGFTFLRRVPTGIDGIRIGVADSWFWDGCIPSSSIERRELRGRRAQHSVALSLYPLAEPRDERRAERHPPTRTRRRRRLAALSYGVVVRWPPAVAHSGEWPPTAPAPAPSSPRSGHATKQDASGSLSRATDGLSSRRAAAANG